MFGNMVSNLMIKPGKSPVFGSPKDVGLNYQDVEFEASDGVTLRGWLINGGADRVVIQSHFGVQCSRSGYTPKGKGLIKMWKEDISFLGHARHLNEQGYTVLMYDLRNHGESDLGTCPWVSWGPEEAKDVIAAVDYITRHPGYKDAGIGLLSICMGAAASTYAFGMADQGLRHYPNVKAMIAVQPLHYKEFVRAFGIPGFLNKAGTQKSLERVGFDLNERTFMSDVKTITVPTLVVQNRNDPWTDLDFVQRYYDELQVEKELIWLDLAKSRAAAYDYLPRHPEEIVKFFDKYVRSDLTPRQ
jgi:pimeloyl-ACP methyl ester carboxylesterase